MQHRHRSSGNDSGYAAADLAAELRRLGIRPGDVLIVHSSMKSIGRVQGGPETVVAALQQAVGPRGTIVMPAFAFHFEKVYWPVEPYDPNTTPSKVGLISETFRDERRAAQRPPDAFRGRVGGLGRGIDGLRLVAGRHAGAASDDGCGRPRGKGAADRLRFYVAVAAARRRGVGPVALRQDLLRTASRLEAIGTRQGRARPAAEHRLAERAGVQPDFRQGTIAGKRAGAAP